MLFNESRYQKEEPKSNSLRNIAYTAAAAVGLVTAAPIIAKAGKDLLEKEVTKKVLTTIGVNAAQVVQTSQAAIISTQGNTALLQENLLGEAAGTLVKPGIREKVYTGLTKTAKHQGFSDFLSTQVGPEGRMFGDEMIQGAIAQLDDVFSAGSNTAAQEALNSSGGLERLQALHKEYLKKASAGSRISQDSFRDAISGAVSNSFATPQDSYHDVVKNSAEVIAEMQEKAVQKSAGRDGLLKLASDPGGKEFTFGDLFDMEAIKKGGSTLANQIAQGTKDSEKGMFGLLTEQGQRVQKSIEHSTGGKNKTFLQDTLKDFMTNQVRLFEGSQGGIDSGSTASKMFSKTLDLFETTKTGLVDMTEATGRKKNAFGSSVARELFSGASTRGSIPFLGADGGVVSQALVAKQIRDSASKIGQEFTIPLLPGLFNIKASKLFGFLKSDDIGIKDLGYLARQTEVKGARSGEYGLSAGNSIFGLEGTTLRKVGDKPYRLLATGESDATKRALRDRNKLANDTSGFLGITDFEDDWKKSGPVGAIRNFLQGPGDQNTKARQLFYSKQDALYDISEDTKSPGHVILTPKKGLEGVGGALLKAVNGSNSVPIQHVNKLGLEMLEQQNLSSDMKMRLATHLSTQAATTPTMINDDVQRIFAASDFGGEGKFFVSGMRDVVDQTTPEGRWSKMLEKGWFDIRSKTGVDQTELDVLQQSGSLYKSIDYAQGSRAGFTGIGSSSEGRIPSMMEGVFGSGLSSGMDRNLTSALLEEGTQRVGFSKVQKIIGDRDVEEVLADKVTDFKATNRELDQIDSLFSTMLGLNEESIETQSTALKRLYSSLGKGGEGSRKINVASVKSLMGLVGGDEIVRNMDVSDVTKAKIVEKMTTSLGSFKFLQVDYDASLTGDIIGHGIANRAVGLVGEGSVGRTINKRFGFGGKIPDPPDIDVTDLTANLDYYAVAGMEDGKMGDYLMGSLKAMFDPKAQQTALSHGAKTLLTSSNTMLEGMGLALKPSDTQTVQSFVAGIAVKRALPGIIAYEMYKNINDDAETYGVPGIDDLAVNARANIGLGVRGILDKTGITDSMKEFARRHPGLDRYMNPRSKEEYEEYLLYGHDAIRRGRFLALGNKGQFAGGDVEYFRANFYQRGKSGWEGADNVQWASAETSFLPTLTNPLAPLTRLLGPSWEERVRKERPYIPGEDSQYGQGDGSGQLGSSNIFRTNAQSYAGMTGYFGGYRDSAVYSEVTDAQISAMSGGGEGQYTGGFGKGPGVSTERITTYLDKQTRPQALSNGMGDGIISAIERYRDQSGLYGGLLKAISFGSGKNYYDIPIQSSSSARDMRRYLYADKLGELTGESGEALRRILGFPDKDEDAYSPYRNNMPQWLVESDEMLGYGDVYLRRPNGEQLLPGDAFCVAPDTLVETQKGLVKAIDIREGDLLKSHLGRFQPVLKPVIRDVGPNEKAYRFSFASLNAYPLVVTEEHPILSLKGCDSKSNDPDWILAKDLEKGDIVCYPKPILHENSQEITIDLQDWLPECKFTEKFCYYNSKISDQMVEALDIISQHTEQQQVLEESLRSKIRKPPHVSQGTWDNAKTVTSKKLGTRSIKRFLQLEEDFFYFLGWYLAEGWSDESSIHLAMNTDELDIGYQIIDIIRKYFGVEGKIVTVKGTNSIKLTVNFKPLALLVKAFVGKYSSNKKLNPYLFTLPKNMIICLLRGYFQGDGYVLMKGRRVVGVSSASEQLIHQVRELLLGLECIGNVVLISPHQSIGPKEDVISINTHYKLSFTGSDAAYLSKLFFNIEEPLRVLELRSRTLVINNKWIGLVVQEKEEEFLPIVVGFEVPGDSSFCVYGVATHNSRINQWVRPNKVNVDLLGETDADIMESMVDPVGYQKRVIFDNEQAKIAKMEALKILQQQGVLGGSNVAVYNVEHNYSSTVDALAGSSPIKIVTVDSMGFQNKRAGYAAEESLQLEMAAMGANQGGLMFVNYEDPSQTYLQMVNFNQGQMYKALGRIESAREQLGALRDANMLSPYETYDPLARLQVLARTAPNSRQTKELERYFSSSVALGGYERIVFQNIKRDLDLVRRDYDFHFDKGSFKTRPVYSTVNYVSEDGQIVTDSGIFRVGGIEWEPELLESGNISNILAQYGIEAGKKAFFTTNESALDPDFMGQQVFSADFRMLGDSVSQNLVQAGYARESVSSDPISRRALGQSSGGMWEDFVHMDFLLQNKFLRARTPSEQLARGDVYGSDYMDWRNLGSTLVGPTISNWASKTPLHAALLAGSVGYIAFGVSKTGKSKVGAAFAMIGAAASVARGLYESVTGKKWKPGRTRRKDEFEDYYDALQYVKYSRLTEYYKDQAFLRAGENVDLMNRQPERFKRRVSKWSMLAVEAERKARATRLGFDLANGTFDEMIATISEGRRQAVKEAALYGDRGEKKKVFDLLSKSEQMVASKFLLGKQRTMVSASDIFMNAHLPEDSWEGWNEDVDIRDIKTRARLAEGINSRPISEKEIRQARNNTMGVAIPNMDYTNRTPLVMKAKLDTLMLGIGLKNQGVNARLTNPAVNPSEVEVTSNIKENETPALSSYIQERAFR